MSKMTPIRKYKRKVIDCRNINENIEHVWYRYGYVYHRFIEKYKHSYLKCQILPLDKIKVQVHYVV